MLISKEYTRNEKANFIKVVRKRVFIIANHANDSYKNKREFIMTCERFKEMGFIVTNPDTESGILDPNNKPLKRQNFSALLSADIVYIMNNVEINKENRELRMAAQMNVTITHGTIFSEE